MRDAVTWDETIVRQPPPGSGAGARGEQAGADPGTGASDSFFRMPARLARDWIEVARLGTGGQARVLQVRARRQPEITRVLKIYNPGSQPRREVVDRYPSLDTRHVVRMFESNAIDDQHYELMEYLGKGSLDRLILREGPRVPPVRVREILVELTDAIAHIHEAGIAHRDLKPGNVLVRRRRPLDLVLADFGIAATMNALSERVSTGGRTVHYAPRETLWNRVSREADWWSLGIMLVEMLTGRHPLSWEHSGELMDAREVTRILTTEPADNLVANVTDPDWRLLCRGLLRHERAHRWRSGEIRRWLQGEREPTLNVTDEAPRTRRRRTLAGVEITSNDPVEVARILSERWEAARADFIRGRITEWASDDPLFPDIPEALRAIDAAYRAGTYRRDEDEGTDEALFRTLIVLAPSIEPRFMGFALTQHGLDESAIAAINGDLAARTAIRHLFERRLLDVYASETGAGTYHALQEQWAREVERFLRLAVLVPEEALALVEQRIDVAVALSLRGSLADAEAWLAGRRARAAEDFRRAPASASWVARLRRHIAEAGAGQLVVLDAALDHLRTLRAAEAARRAARPPMERLRDSMGIVLRGAGILAAAALVLTLAVPAYRAWEASHDTARASQVVTHISFGRAIDPGTDWLVDPAVGNSPEIRGNSFALTADYVNAHPGSDRIEFTLNRQSKISQKILRVPNSEVGSISAEFSNIMPGDYVIQTRINGTLGFAASVRLIEP